MPSDLILLQPHGCLTVRKFLASGSLKDYLHDAKPKLNYLKKTMKPKNLKPFDLNIIRTLGHQVLSTLKFLHEKNLVHGNLHAGNVYMLNGSISISEIENYLMGASSILRPFIVQLKGPSSSAEAVDVYSFGHLMYEMAIGVPLRYVYFFLKCILFQKKMRSFLATKPVIMRSQTMYPTCSGHFWKVS